METTRHFVTTVFLVNDDQIALHEHKKLGLLLPPGGHIDRDELPHESGEREVHEETGIEVDLGDPDMDRDSSSRKIPEPEHLLLDDIVTKDGEPAHQHINLVYFAEVDNRDIKPQGESEVEPDKWYWVGIDDLKNGNLPIETDEMTVEMGVDAIKEFV